MLSRKKRSITGNKVAKFTEVNIKPSKARKIIRRYHFLINRKKVVCDKLGISHDKVDETDILDSLDTKSKQNYLEGFQATDMELPLLRVQDETNSSRELLCKSLGYIMREISSRGGLKDYQLASRIGQSTNRGGDSSKILVSWMKELGHTKRNSMTALEIGSLNCNNCISTCGIFNPVTRIDLNNTNDTRGILRQDFMQRPIPDNDDSKFHLISCSLVLNFVPTPVQRGQMLKRFHLFLKKDTKNYLFLVLPLPCINNSRYNDKEHFTLMMSHLGYSLIKYYEAKKLCYLLFTLKRVTPLTTQLEAPFNKKKPLHDGRNMNNFCILLE